MAFFIIACALLAAIAASPLDVETNDPCNQGPDYWCKNEAMAEKCGVEEYCRMKWSGEKEEAEENAEPVKLSLYYESLCPDCQLIIAKQLFPVWESLRSSGIMTVDLVPYGNANDSVVEGKRVFQCQHGEPECLGNMVMACAIQHMKSDVFYMPFVQCFEHYGPTVKNTAPCAVLSGWEGNPMAILECVTSGEGASLLHLNGVRTNSLAPKHTSVPWMTVNDKHNEEMQYDLGIDMMGYICGEYKGKAPAVCSQNTINPANAVNLSLHRCPRDI